MYLFLSPSQHASLFFSVVLSSSHCAVQGNLQEPCASSSFGVGSIALNIKTGPLDPVKDDVPDIASLVLKYLYRTTPNIGGRFEEYCYSCSSWLTG